MLNAIKQNWNRFVLFAVALMTLFSQFVISPPVSSGGELWYRYGGFLVALLTGLWYPVMKAWSARKFAWRWWALGALVSAISTVAFLHYNDLLERWTVPYWGAQRAVIGKTVTADAAAFRTKSEQNGPPMDDLRLLKSYGGNAAAVWNVEEVYERQRSLTLWYLTTVLALASAAITIAQAAYCAGSPTRARPL